MLTGFCLWIDSCMCLSWNFWKEKISKGKNYLPNYFHSLLPLQYHICLYDSGNHGNASHQHYRWGGAHVLCPSTRMVQCHVLRTRLPDAWTLYHHDPEGIRNKYGLIVYILAPLCRQGDLKEYFFSLWTCINANCKVCMKHLGVLHSLCSGEASFNTLMVFGNGLHGIAW